MRVLYVCHKIVSTYPVSASQPSCLTFTDIHSSIKSLGKLFMAQKIFICYRMEIYPSFFLLLVLTCWTEGGIPDPGKCGKFCPKLRGRGTEDDCEEICADDKRQGVFVKVFVGVVMPHVAPSGDSTFDLCQGGKCVAAGKVSSYGSTTERVDNPPENRIDNKKFYLAQTEVTEVMIKQDWTLEKPLVAKMTKSMVGNLPQPVVVLQELSKGGMKAGGRVILSPEEKRQRYGNLLDKYSS